MAIITRSKRHLTVYFFTALLMVFLGVIFANRVVIAQKLDNWQLLPHSQGVTELYFADDKQLPAAARVDSTQNVMFTIKNLEHKATTYHYKLIVTEEGAVSGKSLGSGVARLNHDEQQTIHETIKIPLLYTARAAIGIELEYQGVPFGSKTLNAQHQAIQYWINVVGLRA